MYTIPNQLNLAIVPSQISPVGVLAAISKNGRYATISQKLRGVEQSLSTLYIYIYRFSGGVDFRKGIAEYVMPLYPPFWRPFKQNGGHFQRKRISQKLYVYVLWGTYFIESIAEYIMSLHPPFWKPFKKHGGHFQSNTSISETRRRRAFNFDSMSRFCRAYTCRKSIVSYVSVLGINHFDVYGGHFTKWRPFP